MIFDLGTVTDQIERTLKNVNVADAARADDITASLGLCLDDLATRFKAKGSFLKSDTASISVSDQTVSITGTQADFRHLFALRFATSDYIRILDYKDPKQFLRDHDVAITATNGKPSIYTVLTTSDEGLPTIKFDRPSDSTATLTIYYVPDITLGSINRAKSVSAIVNGSLAYFYGPGTTLGAGYYQTFKELVTHVRSSDDIHVSAISKFIPSRNDQEVNDIRWILRNKRSG